MRIANFLVNVRRRSLIVGALYGVIAISCTQVPLLNYLGYEFSALMAVIASIIAGLETILGKFGFRHLANQFPEMVPESYTAAGNRIGKRDPAGNGAGPELEQRAAQRQPLGM